MPGPNKGGDEKKHVLNRLAAEAQRGGGSSGNGEKYWILPDGEYRIWVRNNISAGLTARVLGFLGFTTLAGFGGLYYGLSQVAEDVIGDKLTTETVVMKNDVIDAVKQDLTPAIQSGIVTTLVEKTELVKAATGSLQKKAEEEVSIYLATDSGRKALLNSISENSVVESAILRRALTVVESSQDPNQRAQALPLVLLFRPDQVENKKLLVSILREGSGELTGSPLEDNALTDRALRDYPFADVDVPGAKDAQLDADAIDAALGRLEKLSDPQATQLAEAYNRFLSKIPLRYLSKLRAWLLERSDTSVGNLVALALLEQKDDEGLPQIASMLNPGYPVSAQEMAVRVLSQIRPGGEIAAQPRYEALLALWSARTNSELTKRLGNSRSGARRLGTGPDFMMPVEDLYSGLTLSPILDEALLRLLRADDENSDWDAFFVPNLLKPLEDDDILLNDVFSLWRRRLLFEQQQGLKIESAAGRTLETLTDEKMIGALITEDMTFVEWLVGNVGTERLQRFIEGYPALFSTVQPSRYFKPSLLAAAIRRDAVLSTKRPLTWTLLDGKANWSTDFVGHVREALTIAAGEPPENSDPERLFYAARGQLAMSRSGADSDLAVMLTLAAQFDADQRRVRAAVFKSGILSDLSSQSDPSDRLRKVAAQLNDAYPPPLCPNEDAANFESPSEERYTLAVEIEQTRRVKLPEGRQLTAVMSPDVQNQKFDLFIWDAECRSATWHINEATGTLQIGGPGGEEVVVQLISEGKASRGELSIQVGPTELIPGDEAQKIVIGRTYQVTPTYSDNDDERRSFNISLDLQAGEAAWLATNNLVGGTDTIIEVSRDGQWVGESDDVNFDVASAFRIVAPTDGSYRVAITNLGEGFRSNQGFTLRTLKSSPGQRLQAVGEMPSAPKLEIDRFIEIAGDPNGSPRYVTIVPDNSADYQIESLIPYDSIPPLRAIDKQQTAEVRSVGGTAVAPVFRLEAGKTYSLQVPAGIESWTVVRVKKAEAAQVDLLGATAAATGEAMILGRVTDRPGSCYARDQNGTAIIVNCPPGY